MAKLRVQPFEDMSEPAILVNADQDGIRMFQSAVRSAHEYGEVTFEFDGIKHHVVRQDGAADVELGPQIVSSAVESSANKASTQFEACFGPRRRNH